MSFLSSLVGYETSIYLSNLPGLFSASSRISGAFVAAITNIFVLCSKPSISFKSWNIGSGLCEYSLLTPIESISSMNIIAAS